MSDAIVSVLRRSGIGVHPLEWRLPPIETYPSVVAFVQTWAGKLALFVAFALAMEPLSDLWLESTMLAAFVALAGPYRRHAAVLATGAMLVYAPHWLNFDAVETALDRAGLTEAVGLEYLRAAFLLGTVPLALAAIHLARRYRDHPLGRRPVLAQHLLCFFLLGLASSNLLHGWSQVVLWSLTAVYLGYFWFLAYALLDQRRRQPAPLLYQLATFHPFFAPTTMVPMGKGAANWQSVEAGTAEELAVTQLKGLKLLVWAFFLKVLLWTFHRVVYDRLGVTHLEIAFDIYLETGEVPVPGALVSILVNFPEQLLNMAIWGHVIIAVARLAGFRLLRNSWRPLSSRTIAEFWNRFFYYFKEVLVHVYFYPTYVRCFKRHPRLRIAFATFMAAGVGNFFFHFVLDHDRVARLGLFESLYRAQTYAFYCVALSAGIILSQLRARQPNPAAGFLRDRVIPSLWVALFFCFLSFFDGPQRHVSLRRHFDFLFQAFGADPWILAIW